MTDFITLPELKAHVNINGTNQDTELGEFLSTACDYVKDKCGPIATDIFLNEFVELTTIGVRQVILRNRPLISIQAITLANTVGIDAGYSYDPMVMTMDREIGAFRRISGARIAGPILVSYTAGYAVPPSWAVMAAKLIAQDLFQSQRGANRRPSGENDPMNTIGIPARAAMLMEPHYLSPGVG